jgi:hypothetical protein
MSFSTKYRMSLIAYFRIAIRSIPKPNAHPVYFSGSIPHALNTLDAPSRTRRAPPSAACLQVDIDFRTRLGERKKARAEAHLRLFAEVRVDELHDGALQVDHRHVLINHQRFELVEHRQVRLIVRVRPIDATGNHHADRRLLSLHHADLHSAGLRAQQPRVLARAGGLRCASRSLAGIDRDVIVIQRIARRMTSGMFNATKL